MKATLVRHPALGVLSGAFAICFSGILYRFAEVSPTTGAFFRCVWALPFLWPLAIWEDRRLGPRPAGLRRAAWVAGAFFAADLVLWHYAIEEVGAGLATVLGNMQVVIVGLLAWALFRERLSRGSLLAIPVAMLGILLISGVLEGGAYGDNPALGAMYGVLTGLAYSGFLLALRRGSDPRRVAGPLFEATLASMVFVVPIGLVLGNLDFTPPLEATLWLIVLALTSQVVGWLLISVSLARLPTALTSVLLTVQPLLSVLFAAWLVDERPSPLQLVGAAAILVGLIIASVGRGEKRSVTLEPLTEH
ncbi:MAG: DMT family transporter [Actinobacteria bacterium]|nr:DMT family transporter [Actinomycetota bacterium]